MKKYLWGQLPVFVVPFTWCDDIIAWQMRRARQYLVMHSSSGACFSEQLLIPLLLMFSRSTSSCMYIIWRRWRIVVVRGTFALCCAGKINFSCLESVCVRAANKGALSERWGVYPGWALWKHTVVGTELLPAILARSHSHFEQSSRQLATAHNEIKPHSWGVAGALQIHLNANVTIDFCLRAISNCVFPPTLRAV